MIETDNQIIKGFLLLMQDVSGVCYGPRAPLWRAQAMSQETKDWSPPSIIARMVELARIDQNLVDPTELQQRLSESDQRLIETEMMLAECQASKL